MNERLTESHIVDAEQKAAKTFADFSMIEAFYYVKDTNPSNAAPYHNWYHTLTVVNSATCGAEFHELPHRSFKHLLLAALFHDFAHSAGKLPDYTNVAKACSTFRNLPFYVPKGIDRDEVCDLIEVTEYPFQHTPRSIEQCILRDADLTQSLYPGWYDMVIEGLRIEMATAGKVLTTQEMIDGQRTFLREAKLYSRWGIELVSPRHRDLALDLDTFVPLPQQHIEVPQ